MLERVIFAFGLLEAITKTGMPFCFKGGTSLMLLFEHPRRLSTDIDIIVPPGTDIDGYIAQAGVIFPFLKAEEEIRIGKNKIEKRHFRFTYRSPKSGKEVAILLDALFEDIHYGKTLGHPIKNELLLTEGEDLSVTIPDGNSVLGDKLTAFAPHTTGIPFGVNKELEIIKQLFDCGCLFDIMDDFDEVKSSYGKIVKAEMEYRGLTLAPEDVLKDTIAGCLCIASRGALHEEDYPKYKDGIGRVSNHIVEKEFTGETAGAYAARVLYLAASMLIGSKECKQIKDPKAFLLKKLVFPKPKSFNYLRNADRLSYSYILEAGTLLQKIGLENL